MQGMTTMMGNRVDAALDLAAKGFRVFPLTPNAKTPALSNWKKKATTDEKIIRKWWTQRDYNIGVATGQGIFVVDYDCKPGQRGEEALKKHQLVGYDADTLVVKTPNGTHVYYATDETTPTVHNSVSAIAPHVDVRGEGGYVVGPGSTIGEKTYEITQDAKPQPAPKDLLHHAAKHHSPKQTTPLTELDTDAAIARAKKYLEHDAPEAIEGSGGDETTYKIACNLKDFGIAEQTALDLLSEYWNEEKAIPPWDYDALQAKVANAYTYGSKAPGAASAEAEFEPVTEIIETKRPKLYAVDFRDGAKMALTSANEPLIKGLLDKGALSVLYGQSNSGKTFITLDMAYKVATGQPWNGRKSTKGLVVYVAAEGGKGIFKRLKAIQIDQKTDENPPLKIVPCPIDLLHGQGPESDTQLLIDLIREIEEKANAKADLIVIDTLSRALAGGDENSSQDMGTFIKHIDKLRAATKAHTLIVHHSGKDMARGARGWSGIRAAVDTEIEIDQNRITITKQRDLDPLKPTNFDLRVIHIGKDTDNEAVTSCVVDLGALAEFKTELRPVLQNLLGQITELAETHRTGPEPQSVKLSLRQIEDHLAETNPDKEVDARRRVYELVRAGHLEKDGRGLLLVPLPPLPPALLQ